MHKITNYKNNMNINASIEYIYRKSLRGVTVMTRVFSDSLLGYKPFQLALFNVN